MDVHYKNILGAAAPSVFKVRRRTVNGFMSTTQLFIIH